jgi:hypothetical protein
VADRFWVVLWKGERPSAARPFLGTGDPRVVGDLLSSLARHLGLAVPAPRRAPAALHPVPPRPSHPDGGGTL